MSRKFSTHVNANVLNPDLWITIRNEAREKFQVFPSAYASSWISREYKKRGGTFSDDEHYVEKKTKDTSDLTRWFNELWVNVCEPIKDAQYSSPQSSPQYPPCGRKHSNLDHYENDYPFCRPSVRVSSKTPKTVQEFSKSQLTKLCAAKRSQPQGVNGKPTRISTQKIN